LFAAPAPPALPGFRRLVAAAAAPSLLGSAPGEAVPAVNRAVRSGLEWHFGNVATIGARCREHLARRGAVAASATTTAEFLAAVAAAVYTASRRVLEPTAVVVLLVFSTKDEILTALDAGQCFVGIRHLVDDLLIFAIPVVECAW
jgi:hypothetical protein